MAGQLITRNVIGMNLDKKVPVMPLGKELAVRTKFKILRIIDNGNLCIQPLEGPMKGSLCVLSSTCAIALDMNPGIKQEVIHG